MTVQTTVSATPPPPANPVSPLRALFNWLLSKMQPHPSLTDTEDRRKAQLLSPLVFALAVVLTLSGFISIFTSTFFPDPSISLGPQGTVLIFVTAGGFWLAYWQSLTPTYTTGAWLTIFFTYFFLTVFMLLYQTDSVALNLGYTVPVILATIFLSSLGAVRVFIVTTILSLVMLVISHGPMAILSIVFGIMLMVALLTLLVAVLRDQDLKQVKRLRELEAAEGERLRGELELARKVQQAMLPKDLPQVPNLELAAYSQPAFEASGDFYDAFTLNQGSSGKIGIVVCDVAGKGVSSALVMSATRAALRAEAERHDSPAAVLHKVNEVLASSIPSGLFVTLFYGIYDPAARTLRYASAGHPHPYWWSGEQITELQNYGMPLGLMAESEYEDLETTLKPGQTVFIYTDGLVEALNPRRELFGFTTVERKIGQYASTQMEAPLLIENILKDMETFVEGERQQDDVTIVVLRVKES